MIENSSFLFIPDISGFTNFVKQIEITHSHHIIAELLETIIDANDLDLTLAEIEGDAVFFYKYLYVPSQKELLNQVKKMYTAFHNHLKLYETRRICECGACSSAVNLSLKFIAHAGTFQLLNVKEHKKPFGEDVIAVHRLLKNDIPAKEYILLTEQLLSIMSKQNNEYLEPWYELIKGTSYYEKMGEIEYQYSNLKDLQKYVSIPHQMAPSPLSTKPLVVQTKIKASKEDVYELISNFDHRLKWNKKLDQFHYEKNKLNRLGSKHICVIGKNNLEFETVTNNFGSNKMVYGEKTTQFPFVKESSTYFILEGIDSESLLRIEVHFKPVPFLGYFLSPIFKKMISKTLKDGIQLIKQIAENE